MSVCLSLYVGVYVLSLPKCVFVRVCCFPGDQFVLRSLKDGYVCSVYIALVITASLSFHLPSLYFSILFFGLSFNLFLTVSVFSRWLPFKTSLTPIHLFFLFFPLLLYAKTILRTDFFNLSPASLFPSPSPSRPHSPLYIPSLSVAFISQAVSSVFFTRTFPRKRPETQPLSRHFILGSLLAKVKNGFGL